ncbi:HpcH/HpaI aldolase family protein [Novosphingobium lindaniclasticum]
MPSNAFKQSLREPDPKIGLWLACGDPYMASLAGQAGFDWLLIDAEHGPNDLRSILAQLQVLESSRSQIVVRPCSAESADIKPLLDIGVQNLLLPMVETAQQAATIVSATRYPPEGTRGMGAGIGWASRFGTEASYIQTAQEDLCIIVQAETANSISNIAEIAAVDGIGGIFIGPADLAADLGHTGNIAHPDVLGAIERTIRTIVASGKPAGILTFDHELNERCVEWGATIVAVGADVSQFMRSLIDLRSLYRPDEQGTEPVAY